MRFVWSVTSTRPDLDPALLKGSACVLTVDIAPSDETLEDMLSIEDKGDEGEEEAALILGPPPLLALGYSFLVEFVAAITEEGFVCRFDLEELGRFWGWPRFARSTSEAEAIISCFKQDVQHPMHRAIYPILGWAFSPEQEASSNELIDCYVEDLHNSQLWRSILDRRISHVMITDDSLKTFVHCATYEQAEAWTAKALDRSGVRAEWRLTKASRNQRSE